MIALFLAAALASAPALAPADRVDPFVGTSGTKIGGPIDDFPGADAPFGMVQFSPDTPSQNAGGGYEYADKAITGFTLDHLSGPGCSVFGDFGFLPVTALPAHPAAASQPFTHANESATAGYYRVDLGSPAIRAELTAAPRSGFARFTFPAGAQQVLLVNPASDQAGVQNAGIRVVSPTEIEGWAISGNFCGMPDVYTVWFTAQFDQPIVKYGTWNGDAVTPGERSAQGPHTGAYLQFSAPGGTVQMRAAISWVGPGGARANLAAQPSWNFDAVRNATHAAWNDLLDRVHVTGGTPAEARTFYTALYHALLHPNLYSDENGEYRGFDGRVHRVRAGHAEYANYSGWDIYRTLTPLLALVAPHRTSDMMQSLVDAARQGGWLPKWSLVNGYTAVMGGDSADPIIAAAQAFGARDFDARAALDAMIKNADDTTSPPGQGWYLPRPGGAEFNTLGYVPNTYTTNVSPVPNGASLTLEYARDDFAISRFARDLGDTPVARRFLERSQNWANVFDSATRWIEPRGASGAFDPTPIGPNGQSGFQEGNTTQYTWMVPYDLDGLIDGLGGRAAALAQLDSVFTQMNAGQDKPYIWLGNEPSLNAPWTYLNAGAPWKAQQVLRTALTTLYADAPDGIPGNDDLGTMSAWYVWNAIGLYPENPSVRGLAIGTPLFTSVRITSPAGVTIDVEAPQASDADAYLDGLRVDGTPTQRLWTALPQRGTFIVDERVAATPDKAFGTAPADEPPSYPAGPIRFPAATAATIAAQTPAPFDAAESTAVTFAFNGATSPAERFRWSLSLPPGIAAEPASGETSGGTAVHVVLRGTELGAHLYPVRIAATAENGALLAPVTLSVRGPSPTLPWLAYAANLLDNTITPFDPSTGAAAAPIAVGSNPAAIVVDMAASRVFVANQGSNDVSVVDPAQGRTVATVRVGKGPNALALAPDGSTLWVANGADGTVQPIDLATLRAGTAIVAGHAPSALAFGNGGRTLYAVDAGGNAVVPIDVASGAARPPIPVGRHPDAIVVSPDGSAAFVADVGGNAVSKIDLAAETVLWTKPAGVAPQGIALGDGGQRVYAAANGTSAITVLAASTGARIGIIDAALEPVALSPAGDGVLLASSLGRAECLVIDERTGRVLRAVRCGNWPLALGSP